LNKKSFHLYRRDCLLFSGAETPMMTMCLVTVVKPANLNQSGMGLPQPDAKE
jgi:hypothetical protein